MFYICITQLFNYNLKKIEQDFKKQLSRTDFFNQGIRYTDIVDLKNGIFNAILNFKN